MRLKDINYFKIKSAQYNIRAKISDSEVSEIRIKFQKSITIKLEKQET